MSLKVEQMETETKIETVIKKEIEDELNLNVLASQNVVIKEDIEDVQEINPNVAIEDETKMDVDIKDLPISIETKVEDPVKFSITETEPGLMELTLDGIENSDEDESVVLSPEEVRTYLEDRIKEYLTDPKINPFLELTKRSLELQEEFKEKNEEYNKLNKLLQLIYRKQENFLRHMGILDKIPTKSIAISVDLPVEPSELPVEALNNLPNNVIAQNTVSASTKKNVLPPSSSTSVTKQLPKAAEAGKTNTSKPTSSNIECIDLTDELDPPNTNAANRAPYSAIMLKHPAPLPPRPFSVPNKTFAGLPPKPRLKVNAEDRVAKLGRRRKYTTWQERLVARREQKRIQRANATEEAKNRVRRRDAEAKRLRRAAATKEERSRERERDARAHRHRIHQETLQERETRLQSRREHRQRRAKTNQCETTNTLQHSAASILDDESAVNEQSCETMNILRHLYN